MTNSNSNRERNDYYYITLAGNIARRLSLLRLAAHARGVSALQHHPTSLPYLIIFITTYEIRCMYSIITTCLDATGLGVANTCLFSSCHTSYLPFLMSGTTSPLTLSPASNSRSIGLLSFVAYSNFPISMSSSISISRKHFSVASNVPAASKH